MPSAPRLTNEQSSRVYYSGGFFAQIVFRFAVTASSLAPPETDIPRTLQAPEQDSDGTGRAAVCGIGKAAITLVQVGKID